MLSGAESHSLGLQSEFAGAPDTPLAHAMILQIETITKRDVPEILHSGILAKRDILVTLR